MKFSAAVLSSAFFAALAVATPIVERAGEVTLNLYSDGNCVKKIQTITLLNNTCSAATAAFSSAKVVSNPQVAIAEAYNQPGCNPGLTRAWFTTNASVCTNAFQQGPARYIEGHYPRSSS